MRIPKSTYRLQLTPTFTLWHARDELDYLRRLGVDWVYLSPVLESAGSPHGYDVVDPTRIDEARGGADGFRAFCEHAHALGLGVLVDIVPNHMGVGVPRENRWWWDVLENGRDAEHAPFFDIDWDAGEGRVLLPVIGDEDMPREPGAPIGSLVVDREAGVLRYHDNEYPLAPGTTDDDADANAVAERQHYRLIHWRQGDFKLNYRRFFTVTSLAGLRVEDARVFDATHAEIVRWVREGLVDGLRIDHPDGLRDPRGYLDRLAEATGGVYTVVEKILEPGESLPRSWRTDGTTGYDALGEVDRVLTDPAGETVLVQGSPSSASPDPDGPAPEPWPALVHHTKRQVTDGPLRAEVHRITRDLVREGVDHPEIVEAVSELLANFRVYRTYLPEGVEHLDEAAEDARSWRPDLVEPIDRILPVLRRADSPAALRFQQTSGMVMAKAVEDRAFYRYARLTSLNEVGGDPSAFAISLDEFHAHAASRFANEPNGLTTLTTHDTKRGEDVRARLDVLSELPELWEETLATLDAVAPIPDAPLASLVWQAVVGAWPISRERLHAFAEKAAREAGARTSWTLPNPPFERAVREAVDAAFDRPVVSGIITNLVDELREPGWSNALSAKAVQLTMPGVPDVYQGSELWRSLLVDPDNRRPVDYQSREAALAAVLGGARPPVDESGAAKLLVTAACLLLRRERPHLFTTYEPIAVRGSAAGNAIAFSRGGLITLATRLPVALEQGGGWAGTVVDLPEGRWVDQLTSRAYDGGDPAGVSVGALLADYPVALLARSGGAAETNAG